MVVIMKPGTSQNEIRKLAAKFEAENLKVGITNGVGCTILGLVGDTAAHGHRQDPAQRVCGTGHAGVQEPYKKANRKFHPEDTVVDVQRRQGGRRQLRRHGWPLLRGERGADRRGGQSRPKLRRGDAPRRRLQTPHLPLLLPGHGRPRSEAAAGGQSRDWSAHRHRAR